MSMPENPWLLQAENDLEMARLAFENGYFSQTCYHASQSAEKALKSIIIDLGELPPKTHALNRLKGMLSHLGLQTSEIDDLKLNFLTRMHTSTRYPVEDLPPARLFDQSDGEECLRIAEKIIDYTRRMGQGK
ncbi:MAG TPA: HEPN domain-containing protein [SAR324 cluster bacterium]|jgi:HEPN domain-containing protein|nr:HEPN domain-containing protein [SAR324 cluster bacterium]